MNENEMMKLLFEFGAEANASSNDGTPLHCAMNFENEHSLEIITLLLEQGADIDSPVKTGLDLWTPLHQACKNQNIPARPYL